MATDVRTVLLGKTRRVHFVGIGGIGMSGIAELLANLGYAVSGSDQRASKATERLASIGVAVTIGHHEAALGDPDVVVVSSAIKEGNPEVREARRRRIPVIPRAEMLAELMRLRFSIAVAGAHGKTTTASMIAFMLEQAGLDPTAVIGGRVRAFGGNARLGRSDLMVAEADESDRSFLKLLPTIAVLTNIDAEHLENYRGFEDLQQAFVDFANKVPFYGTVVACVDDPHVAESIPRMTRRVVTYGIDAPSADLTATSVSLEPFGAAAVVLRGRGGAEPAESARAPLGALALQVPGRHNLLNALAAVAVGLELGLSYERIARALGEFRGVERRFDVRGEPNGILVIDDYAHHPAEIAAVLEAAQRLGRRLIVAFQPHRFTRTAALLSQFGPSLRGADRVVLTDIYAAGEEPIAGVTLQALADAVRRAVDAPVEIAPSLDDLVGAVVRAARPGDAVLTLGAGSIGSVPDRLLRRLAEPAPRGEASP